MANNKFNKKHTGDLFSGLKFVDNMLNEAAGVKENKKLSFEDRLKAKLKIKENMDAPVEEESIVDESIAIGEDSSASMAVAEDDSLEETNMLASEAEMTEDDMEGGAGEEGSDINEYNYNGDNYNYNYDGKNTMYEEDPELMEILFEDESEEIAGAPTAATQDQTGDVVANAADEINQGAAPIGDEMGAEDPNMMGDENPEDMTGDMSGDISMGGAPTGGGAGAAPTGDTSAAPMGGASQMGVDITTQPEDIDALIDSIISENQELSDLGYEDLGDDELGDKVKQTSGAKAQIETSHENEAADPVENIMKEMRNPITKENETPKSTKLGDKDITGSVQGSKTKKTTATAAGDAEGAIKDLDFQDAKVDAPTDTVKAKTEAGVKEPKFDQVKKEAAIKSRALSLLADKYVALEQENMKLKFENYKATKVNAVLTLLPELKQVTREALVKRFDECKNMKEVRTLYASVSVMIKESKRPSLNEAVSKVSKGIKHIVAESTEETGDVSEDQARKNFLMGVKGYEDQYFNC